MNDISLTGDAAPRRWVAVCGLDEIVPNTGVCAWAWGRQVAVFRLQDAHAEGAAEVFAIGNIDPASRAAVLSRGLLGSFGERLVVASPIYKQHYDLRTGECLESPEWSVPVFAARIEQGRVWIAQ